MHGYKTCINAILTKMTTSMRETNHAWLKKLHRDDLNENDNFRNGKLIIYGYRILHGAILTNMNI